MANGNNIDVEMHVQRQYKKQSEYFVQAINNYSGSDPLKLWYQYLCWMDDIFNRVENDVSVMENVLQTCLATFENDAMYKQDRRLLKIFIKFIEMQDTPEQYYELLHENDVGTKVADLYICWAHHFDTRNQYETAERIYSMGLQINAEPLDLLNDAHQTFCCSMSQRILNSISAEQIKCDLTRRYRQYTNIKNESNNLVAVNSLPKSNENDTHISSEQNVENKENEYSKTPTIRKSLIQTIIKSAQKSRGLIPHNRRATAQKLQFSNGEEQEQSSHDLTIYPQHRDEQIDGVCGIIPGYDKIMLFPNEHICFSIEEFQAYKWFKRRKISNNFTKVQDRIWDCGYDIPFRWPPMFCHENVPQSEWDLPPLDDNDFILKPNCHFSFKIRRLYGKCIVEQSNEELLNQKWKLGMRRQRPRQRGAIDNGDNKENTNIVYNEIENDLNEQPIPSQPIILCETKSPDQKVSRQVSNQFDSLPQYNENIVKKSKLSEEYRLMNDTCTTQAFNFCIKSNFVSTPKSNKCSLPSTSQQHQPITNDFDCNLKSSEYNIDWQKENVIARKLTIDANNMDRLLSNSVPKTTNNNENNSSAIVNVQINEFEIYVDETQKTITERAQQCKWPIKAINVFNNNDENAAPNSDMVNGELNTTALDKNDINDATGRFRVRSSPRKSTESIGLSHDELDLSIPLNSYEREVFVKKRHRIKSNNKTNDILRDFGASANIKNDTAEVDEPDDAPENEDDYDNNDKFGRSIYVSHLEQFDKNEPEWDEVTQHGNNIGLNEYQPQQINFDETIQYIDKELLNAANLNPFDSKFQMALLDNMGFMEKLSTFDAETCEMVNLVHPLKPKKTIRIGQNRFIILNQIGKGNFGNVFSGRCLKTSKLFAFKQERPPHVWEYYICREIQNRIAYKGMLNCFMSIEYAIIGNNSTVFVSKYSKYGTLLNVCNKVKQLTSKNLDEYLVMILASQILSMVKYLHAAQIIHGDIKPDNFLVIEPLRDPQQSNDIILQLIDFGQSIDMKLFPRNQVFHNKIKTENFICTEMLDKRPWTYQHDIFCIASTIFTMLCGKYMNVIKRKRKFGYDTQTIPRYYRKEMWSKFFDRMINVPDATQPLNLDELQDILKRESAFLAEQNNVRNKISTFNAAINKDI